MPRRTLRVSLCACVGNNEEHPRTTPEYGTSKRSTDDSRTAAEITSRRGHRCRSLGKSDQFLARAVKFSALRLIVSTFEISVPLCSLNTYILSLVQVGMNILRQPEKAAVELFGTAFCHD